jgi:hypothetical protein
MQHPNFMMRGPIQDVLPEMKENCSMFVYELVERMWQDVPSLRPTSVEVHKWCEERSIPPMRMYQLSREPKKKVLLCDLFFQLCCG